MQDSFPCRSFSDNMYQENKEFSLSNFSTQIKSQSKNEKLRKANPYGLQSNNQNKIKKPIKRNIFKLKQLEYLAKKIQIRKNKYNRLKKYSPPTPYNTTEFICYNQSFSLIPDFSSKIEMYPTLGDLDPSASLINNIVSPISIISSRYFSELDEVSLSSLEFKSEDQITETRSDENNQILKQ